MHGHGGARGEKIQEHDLCYVEIGKGKTPDGVYTVVQDFIDSNKNGVLSLNSSL